MTKVYDCGFIKGNNWFRYRAAAIIIEEACILFAGNEKDDYFYSIGGGVHMGETAEDAVIREVMEETGVHYDIDRLAVIHENFFYEEKGTLKGLDCHEITFYFLMKPRGTKELHSNSYTQGVKESMYWIPIEDLHRYKAFPSFLKDYLRKEHVGIEHIITDDREKSPLDNTQNFTGLAHNYVAGRPAYAKELIESLYSKYGFSQQSVIADIGCGTGKFAKQLLEKNSFVYCVEPNEDMRNMAEEELRGYEKARIINGTAAASTLAEQSVDFVTTAQAFHWFDPYLFRKECQRILKKSGKVFLIWNFRDMSDEINQESFAIYSKYCPRFRGFSGGIQKDDRRIKRFFADHYEYAEFQNPLFYNEHQFISRSLSASYSLKKGEENYEKYVEDLKEVFHKHEKDNMVTVLNKTIVYIGSMDKK